MYVYTKGGDGGPRTKISKGPPVVQLRHRYHGIGNF